MFVLLGLELWKEIGIKLGREIYKAKGFLVFSDEKILTILI